MSDLFPRHYEAWRKCITEKCQIPLTKDYIQERLMILSNHDHQETIKFIEKYGEHWHQQIKRYFEQALQSFNQ